MGSAMASVLLLFNLSGVEFTLLLRNPRSRLDIGIFLIRMISLLILDREFLVFEICDPTISLGI